MSETEWDSIAERAAAEARYMLGTGCTVRVCAAHFHIGKSTVHKDVAERLRASDPPLWEAVRGVLGVNLRERHLRGGAATQRMYAEKRARLAGKKTARASFSGSAPSQDPQM